MGLMMSWIWLIIASNKIADPKVVTEVFAKMKSLKVLYSYDNPYKKNLKFYRMHTIANCKKLTYLDK